MKPLALDLCCGLGGWADGLIAAGWEVIGFDTDPIFGRIYPGQTFRAEDVRYVARHFHDSLSRYGLDRGLGAASLVVASPPCEEFSRHQMPWTKRRNPPPPDTSIWQACKAIAREAEAPLILENVRSAQVWMGPANWHCGSYYLWGSVPALMPVVKHRPKENMSSTWRAERARIPFSLAHHIGRVFHPGGAA